MSSIRNIFVHCDGRLANMLLSWANARYVTRGISSCRLLINYPPIHNLCILPCTLNINADTNGWPRIHTADLSNCKTDCVWLDAWSNFPPKEILRQYINEITYSPATVEALDEFTGKHRYIGVHVRYGDYEAVDPSNPPAIMPPFVRAPNDYYLTRLDVCLKKFPGCEIFLATNGTPDELQWFHQCYPNALKYAEDNPLLDLLTLSKSKIIVGSASTFSTLAALMGEKPLIYPSLSWPEATKLINQLPP